MSFFRPVAYWTALALPVLFLLVALSAFLAAFVDVWVHLDRARNFPWSKLVPVATFGATAVGTFSAVFFGWRIDRRQSKRLELKVLEFESRLGGDRVERKVPPAEWQDGSPTSSSD